MSHPPQTEQAPNRTEPPQVTFSRDYNVAAPRPERAYLIPASEWDRLKRMVKGMASGKDWFVVTGSICVGIFVSAVFCLIGFSPSWDNVPMWAKAISLSAALCSLVLGIALFVLSNQQTGKAKESSSEITTEMERLEDAAVQSDQIIPGG
jgi:hypothetical protein